MNYSYTNSDGLEVMTSEYLKKRGSCCKTKCLHCPYRYTLSFYPIAFVKCTDVNITQIQAIFNNFHNKNDISSSLLWQAFGTSKKTFNKDHYFLLTLKGVSCGIAEVIDGKLKSFDLLEQFRDQGIDEAYLMSLLSKE